MDKIVHLFVANGYIYISSWWCVNIQEYYVQMKECSSVSICLLIPVYTSI